MFHCPRQLRPIIALAGLNLDIGAEEFGLGALAGNERGDRRLLRLKSETACALRADRRPSTRDS
jgi:hypothetical protein